MLTAADPGARRRVADRLRAALLLGEANAALRRRNVRLTAILVGVGVLGKILLSGAPNIEPILAVSLFAGMVLVPAYALLVPVLAALLNVAFASAILYPNTYGLPEVAALAAFLVTGYLFVGLAGGRIRRRVLFRTRTIALATAVSVPLTVAWDVWTAFGNWLTISRFAPYHWSLEQTFQMQVPFTLLHLISSLVFVPLIGAGLGYYVEHVLPEGSGSPEPSHKGLEIAP